MNQINWDYNLEEPEEDEIDEERKRQDEEDLAQSRAEDRAIDWIY